MLGKYIIPNIFYLIYVIIIQIKYNKIGYQYEKVINNIIVSTAKIYPKATGLACP